MSKKFKYCGFYIPIDALLDTRLGTIAKIDPQLAIDLADTDYRNRKSDDFGKINRVQFLEEYAKRDKETLSLSTVTAIVPVIRDIIQGTALGDGHAMHPQMPKVYINVYPYDFDDEDYSELGLIMSNLFKTEDLEIELFSMSPEELTPQHCLTNYSFMVMYSDYSAWMDMHRYELHKQTIRHIVLFVPALVLNEIPSEEAVLEAVKTVGIHPLEMLEQSGKELIDLTLIDVKYFSITNLAA